MPLNQAGYPEDPETGLEIVTVEPVARTAAKPPAPARRDPEPESGPPVMIEVADGEVVRRDGHVPQPVPDADLYPGIGDDAVLRVCYKAFMLGRSFRDIEASTGVHPRTLRRWASRGRWTQERQALEDVSSQEEAQRLNALRIEKRMPELEAQVETGRKLREAIDAKLEEPESLTPGQIMALGQAAKAAGDLTVRALGVGESGATAAEEAAKEKTQARQPLVVVLPGGRLPFLRRTEPAGEKTIDV